MLKPKNIMFSVQMLWKSINKHLIKLFIFNHAFEISHISDIVQIIVMKATISIKYPPPRRIQNGWHFGFQIKLPLSIRKYENNATVKWYGVGEQEIHIIDVSNL